MYGNYTDCSPARESHEDARDRGLQLGKAGQLTQMHRDSTAGHVNIEENNMNFENVSLLDIPEKLGFGAESNWARRPHEAPGRTSEKMAYELHRGRTPSKSTSLTPQHE